MHGFNFPFQLGTGGDSPDSADFDVIDVMDGDLILLYTDGVSDNLFEKKIMNLIRPFMELHEIPDVEIIAEMVCETAQEYSLKKDYKSPFAIEAEKNNFGWEGGKPDDITAVIA